MTTTRKYWIELLQAYFSVENEDTSILLDDYDAADYLQMALETTIVEVIQGKYKGVNISSMGVWYDALSVIGKTTELPFTPILGSAGVITVRNGDTIFYPRVQGVESTALGFLKGKGVKPSYSIYNNELKWEYAPAFTDVDVFMVPSITELADDDEFKLAAGVKDIMFQRVKLLAIDKLKFKPDYKNNTYPDQPNINGRKK